jgi:hypothetical protein
VRRHGIDELIHPKPGFYIVGMKSYDRAPTFLLLTGCEQVRSVSAALAGDWEAARRAEPALPETGVCSGRVAAGVALGLRLPVARQGPAYGPCALGVSVVNSPQRRPTTYGGAR